VRIVLYVIAGLEVFAALFAVGRVGKPRKPVTPADAVAVVIICAVFATVLVLAAGDLR
jgi:hypothetical protein